MRILMVSDDYLPNPGGIAAHVYELSSALAELGHEVDLIVGHDARHLGAPLALPDGARILSHRAFRWSPLGYARMTVSTCMALRRVQAERAYAVCHWHNLVWETCAIASGATRLPRVFTNHSSGYLRRARSKLRLHSQLRAILHVADRVIAPSRELLERSADAGYPRTRLHYIPNGVDVRVFKPGARDPQLMATYGLTAAHRVVVVPRRLDRKNGVDVLLRAVPALALRVPELKVLLVGDGDERVLLEKLAHSLDIAARVVFCGNQPRSEMLRHLRLGHVAALPSRAEAVSLAGLEAMAVGLPVVGSRVGGIPEFVRDGDNGWLVPAEEPAALADALARVLENLSEANDMGQRARASVDALFSWRAAAERTLEVYAAASHRDGLRSRASDACRG